MLIGKKGGLEACAAQIPVITDEVDCEGVVWLGYAAGSQIKSSGEGLNVANFL